LSAKLNIVNTFENSTKKPIVFLVLIALAGLFLRLVYFPYDVPLFNDSQGYFWYAIDMSVLNQLPLGHSLVNNGWPSFLSLIFQQMDSSNFLDYHNMQRFVGVVFSVATIFPVYLLCSRYFKKTYSLLGATLFIFEPRLIGNSLLGVPESMYIFLMASLLFLFLSNDFKKIYLAFAIVALLAIVRYEGLLMIIPTSIVFFIRFRKQKKDLIKYIICMSIFVLILVPMAYLKNETMGQDGFVSHIAAGSEKFFHSKFQTVDEFLYLGSVNLIKYAGWVQIPSFIIFVPLGIIFIFKSLDYKKIIIILSILIMLIPAFYGYSREAQDTKYLYVLYPIFCVLACFTFKVFLEKFHRKNLIFCIIIGGIILSSVIFVDWNMKDNEHEREAFQIMTQISDKNMKINTDFGKYGNELTFLDWARFQNVESFPILKKSMPEIVIKYTLQPRALEKRSIEMQDVSEYGGWENRIDINNFEEYLTLLKKQNITHLILDGEHTSLVQDLSTMN